MSLPPKNMGSPRRKSDFPCFCLKFKLHPQGNHIFFCTTKEILKFYNLPLKNFIAPQPGGGEGVRVLK